MVSNNGFRETVLHHMGHFSRHFSLAPRPLPPTFSWAAWYWGTGSIQPPKSGPEKCRMQPSRQPVHTCPETFQALLMLSSAPLDILSILFFNHSARLMGWNSKTCNATFGTFDVKMRPTYWVRFKDLQCNISYDIQERPHWSITRLITATPIPTAMPIQDSFFLEKDLCLIWEMNETRNGSTNHI